jgi:hypothetical protein
MIQEAVKLLDVVFQLNTLGGGSLRFRAYELILLVSVVFHLLRGKHKFHFSLVITLTPNKRDLLKVIAPALQI